MKHVCVGVHVHAEPKRLLATLESLRRHTSQAIDVLLLPDGPDETTKATLDTLSELRQFGTADPLGPTACFNRLANATNAEVLVLLESGALVGPEWLNYLLAALSDPLNGLAGPSTNRSWNEQAVFPRAGGTLAEVVITARQAAQRFGKLVRTLEPLYSLGDFCYAVRRDVIEAIGAVDESYGLGPCWEMDYNIRAARAGFRSVWACGAYVYRSPFTARRQHEEEARFEASKQRYQDKFCALRLQGLRSGYEPHCRGDECLHFAPPSLIQVRLETEHELPIQNQHTGPHTDMHQGKDNISVTIPTDTKPLVSCIMPTHNRRSYIRQALAYFERQQYPNRELIIVDDGDDKVADLIPADPRLRYVSLPRQTSIGMKRNHACQLARGTIIAHWDDDDWYAPHRLEQQIAPLLAGAADMTGLETSCFFDLTKWEAWTCSPDLHSRLFVRDVHGGTLVYWRWIWEKGVRYPNASLAEDAHFLDLACRRGARLQKLPHDNSFVYLRHESNAWRFPLGSHLQPAGWQRADLNLFLPPADLPFYAALSPAASAPAFSSSAMASKDEPLVSCIMPTYNRRAFVAHAISYFLRQDYGNKELIIVDDGTDAIDDLLPSDERINYIRLQGKTTVGAKRNQACEQARGTIIVHWDDDDWHAPHRLRYQVEALLCEGADLCGTTTLLFYDAENERAWQYVYPMNQRTWLVGGTLCYTRAFWAGNRFANINVGEDTRFVWNSRPGRATRLPDSTFYVGMVHTHNVSPKKTNGSYWRPYPVEEIRQILGADWSIYHPDPAEASADLQSAKFLTWPSKHREK